MRRMSIWPILVELIICLTVLCGCHAEGSVSTPSPDSSRSPYLSELYLLKYDPAFTICDVTVNRVFDYIYDGGYQGDEFLVAVHIHEIVGVARIRRTEPPISGDAEYNLITRRIKLAPYRSV